MRSLIRFSLVILAMLTFSPMVLAKKKVAEQGHKVKVNYTGRLDDGRVFDTSVDKEPITFLIGGGRMLPKFEEAFQGMKKGEKKTITIEAKDAYGAEPDQSKILEISKNRLPNNTKVGTNLNFRTLRGTVPVRVIDITDKKAFLDGNHFLVGKDLIFDVELLDIVEASAE